MEDGVALLEHTPVPIQAGTQAITSPVDSPDPEDHPLRRLVVEDPAHVADINAKISHQRSRSDSATLMDPQERSSSSAAGSTAEADVNSSKENVPSTVSSLGRNTGRQLAKLAKDLHRVGQISDKAPHYKSEIYFDARRRFSGGSSEALLPLAPSSTSVHFASYSSSFSAAASSSRVRAYRSSIAPERYTTRDIAALDFLLGIPLEAEESIVQHGWMLQQRREKAFSAGDDDSQADEEDMTRQHDDSLEPPGAAAAKLNNSRHSHHGRWWEKWVREHHGNNGGRKGLSPQSANGNSKRVKDYGELELPTASRLTDRMALPDGTPTTLGTAQSGGTNVDQKRAPANAYPTNSAVPAAPVYAPGRRLEGDEAILVQIPLKIDTITKQRSIARQAAIREWEIKVAHGLMGMDNERQINTPQQDALTSSSSHSHQPPLLDGRLFFSASGSYPVQIFSLKRYEPKREEAALRRQKLEARGGGGSHFVMPTRDWRGISYRSLLPRKAEQTRNQKAFNRFLRGSKHPRRKRKSDLHDDSDKDLLTSEEESKNMNMDDESDNDASLSSSSSSSSEDSYIPGILDDPEMTLGRHRNVMIGDVVTGCIVASTIQFVKPALLKADLNQKFRERFDGWEPNKSQRKYIGAQVVEGLYTLIDPMESTQDVTPTAQGSPSEPSNSPANATPAIIRMPPSLTLSKIRSIKRQALMAFAKANLEIGTVALACVYFERLCLSCRVDKTNRRLCFASCLLLASKINEPNEVLVIREDTNDSGAESEDEEEKNTNKRKKIKRLQSSIRPNQRSSTMFASLLEFFTQDWSLSLNHLFAAEWGVFAALRFSLHATPSQVAFHFRRLMKTLEWNPRNYLGSQMYGHWQDALAAEESRKVLREKRRELRQVRKERRLQRELQKEVIRSKQMQGNQLVDIESLLRRKSSSKVKIKSISEPSASGGQEMRVPAKKTTSEAEETTRPSSATIATPSEVELSQSVDLPPGRSLTVTPKLLSSKQIFTKSPQVSPKVERMSLPPKLLTTSTPRPGEGEVPPITPASNASMRRHRQIGLLTRLGMRRPSSTERLFDLGEGSARENKDGPMKSSLGLLHSPSMPLFARLGSFSEDQRRQDPSNSSTNNNPNDVVIIDMPPDSPKGDVENQFGGDDEENDNMGIVI